MAGLFDSLTRTATALNAHALALNVTSNNLANVSNENYARQRVIYGSRGMVETSQGAQSMGIETKSVQQVRDALLDRQLLRETSLTASLQSQYDAYTRAETVLGESIDRTSDVTTSSGSGLSSSISEFFNAFTSFAASPTDQGVMLDLLEVADILAQQIQQTDLRLDQIQSDLDTSVYQDAGDVNDLLASLATLNAQISRFEMNAPGSAVDLRDQRQQALEELSGLIGVETRESSAGNGQVDIFVRDAGGAEITLVSSGTVAAPVVFNGTDLVAAGTPVALTGGSIKGGIDARDGAIQTLRDNLDTLAGQLVQSVNGAYNPSGTTGCDFFDAAGTTASGITLDANLSISTLHASDGGAAGDNELAAAVAALAEKTFATSSGDLINGSFTSYYSGAVTAMGQAAKSASSRLADQSTIETLVREQRDAVSGVSLDEEVVNLTKYQRAFQASSRVMTVIDDLLDTVINRLGVA